jgi:hypothetical protein
MPQDIGRSEVFAVNFAALAREIAMDILPLPDILRLHQIDDEQWMQVQSNPTFQRQVAGLVQDWQSAVNVRERMKIKAATALEAQLEVLVGDIADLSIPLGQRVEAAKLLARLGDLDGQRVEGVGERFAISINIGDVHREVEVKTISGTALGVPVIPEEEGE